MTSGFWIQFIQPERRLHIRDTIAEMLLISALLYGGTAVGGIIAMNLPIWPEIDKISIYLICLVALIMSAGFIGCRRRMPLWLTILHVPVGICLLTAVVYLSHAPQSLVISVVYIVASTYTFHYFTRESATGLLLLFAVMLAVALWANEVVGWQAAVFFIVICSLINGEIARITATRINQLATRDKLTALLNRNTIDLIIEDMLRSRKIPFTLLLIDLNRFKAVNDNEGHLRGDEVLKQVADAMLGVTPAEAYAARWGGDEFMIVLPGDDRELVAGIDMEMTKRLQNVIGFESGISFAREDDDLDSLVHRADAALYVKKRNRRATDRAVA